MDQNKKISVFSIPNGITCLNLISGAVAIERALYGDLQMALLFMLLAALFDFFDGFAARLCNAYSTIGKDLDSLADVVSFGVAPASMAFSFIVDASGQVWYAYAAFIFSAMAALRLAKFNNDPRQSMSFLGLPSPAAALLLGGFVYNWSTVASFFEPLFSNIVVLIFALISGVLMLVELPMFALKIKNFSIKKYALQMLFVLFGLILLLLYRLEAIVYILLVYILISLTQWLWRVLRPNN